MALIEDMFKGNLAAGLAMGAGVVIFGPMVIQTIGIVLRPPAKTLIKGGMIFYREILGEIGEMASDLVAEARAELDQEAQGDRRTPATTGAATVEEHRFPA